MNFFGKSMVIAGFLLCSVSLIGQQQVSADNRIEDTCDYQAVAGENPDYSTMNCLLTETALAYDVPPEIVKAIAEKESGNWKQFDEKGETIVTDDNGIGVMQITNQAGYEEERLRTDVLYNIHAGVEILDYMFERNDLPVINNGERAFLENWYFAIMAYNGIKPANSPLVQENGTKNEDAYQELVSDKIENLSMLKLKELPFSVSDFDYDPNSTENIVFVKKHYQVDIPLTKSKHYFQGGQVVASTGKPNIRMGPTTDSTSLGNLTTGEKVTIEGSFKYEENVNRKNHFVWYPVKRNDGTSGYVSSSYLDFTFKDVPHGHYAYEEINYLADKGILLGVGKGNFGFEEELTRWQAVLLLTRAEDIPLANRPDPGFEDVPKDYKYFSAIAAAVDEGMFKGVSPTEFKPKETLTRREMAKVLDNIYQFPQASSSHPFTDVKDGYWFSGPIARLYDAGISDGVTTTKFGPLNPVTREQFAVFLARSISEEFKTK
jgi:hypothetical protein